MIRQGDALTVLKTMEDDSIDCIVTSPPYWGLRDYGVDGQLGLEETPEEYVANMAVIFHEARRVLKKTGTLWLNLGDSYAGSGKGPSKSLNKEHHNLESKHSGIVPSGLKPKDLVGIPWRVAFALQADGWYLRQDIIWHKPNPMPESVTDRCTKSHEYVFLLSKSAKYYYDANAIKTETKDWSVGGPGVGIKTTEHYGSQNGGNDGLAKLAKRYKMPDGWDTGKGAHGSYHREGREKGNVRPLKDLPGSGNKLGAFRDKQRGHGRRHAVFNDHWDAMTREEQMMRANKRSVWSVATMPFKEAHFATFPEKLIEPMVLAGCPRGGAVLDPFLGSGTTAVVAQKFGRTWEGIEINPEYIAIAERRLSNTHMPML